MPRLIARRLFALISTLFGIVVLTFLLARLIPGSPWTRSNQQRVMMNFIRDSAGIEALNRRYGLDLPLWRQFTRYVFFDIDENGELNCGLICGDLGPSFRQRGSTVQEILFGAPEGKTFLQSRLIYSIRLVGLAFLMAAIVGVPLGVLAATRQNTTFDRIISILSAMGMGVPNFVIGLPLIMLFASGLGWISVIPRWERPGDWILPAVVLAIGPACVLVRLSRASVLEVIRQDYIRTARAKGLLESMVLNHHVLRNALLPIITVLGPLGAELLAGSFVIEAMFGFPGFGREYWEAVANLDYAMLTGITLLYGLIIALANLAVDVIYSFLDPRLREEPSR